jgi:hypothetical protein
VGPIVQPPAIFHVRRNHGFRPWGQLRKVLPRITVPCSTIILQAEGTAMLSSAILLVTSPILGPPRIPSVTNFPSCLLSCLHHESVTRFSDKLHQNGFWDNGREIVIGTGICPMPASVSVAIRDSTDRTPLSPRIRFHDCFTSESSGLIVYLGGGAIYSVKGGRRGRKSRSGGLWKGGRGESRNFGARLGGRKGRGSFLVVGGV